MGWSTFRNRRAAQIENDSIRVTVTAEGGHIAEILHKPSGVNPLWTPPWPSIEPSTYSLEKHPEYGNDAESKLLSGIMGHNLCLDLFGGPSPEEAAAGMTVHGEASHRAATRFPSRIARLNASCVLPAAQLQFERRIRLDGQRFSSRKPWRTCRFWIGPSPGPSMSPWARRFSKKASRSFARPEPKGTRSATKEDFDWPVATRKDGVKDDLRV